MRHFALFLSVLVGTSSPLFSQELCPQWDDLYPLLVEGDSEGVLALNSTVFDAIRAERPVEFQLVWDFPGEEKAEVRAELMIPFWENLELHTTDGDDHRILPFSPSVISYRLKGKDWSGVVNVLSDGLLGTIQRNGIQYELGPHSSGDGYFITPVRELDTDRSFSCAVDDYADKLQKRHTMGLDTPKSMLTECVEVAIDIDHYTYNTFGDCETAANWSLALLAGVSNIYMSDLNNLINLGASVIHIWQSEDPYAAYSGEAGNMLDAFRQEWANNSDLNTLPRDLVHLMTRRGDTGTGGIAYVDVVCSSSYGFGFSAGLGGGTTYVPGDYSWNLQVVAHELGHNFGSNHTHWCGWTGGPIDNCATIYGDCEGYTDNVTAQQGTIMSYCHSISGGSISLNFHELVINEALIPTINSDGSCHGSCAPTVTMCQAYGCTDNTACNYDPSANFDDGSCAELDVCGDCGGNGGTCSGCMDTEACNYDAFATVDSGVCLYPPVGGTCDCDTEVTGFYTLAGAQTVAISEEGSGAIESFDFTVIFDQLSSGSSWPGDLSAAIESPAGLCYVIGGYNVPMNGCTSLGSFPPSWNAPVEGTFSTTVELPELMSGAGTWIFHVTNAWAASGNVTYDVTFTPDMFCSGATGFPGCTDSGACNFDPAATDEDGSCEYTSCAGCTDSGACNYDASATIDDESCEYTSCAGCTDSGACNYDASATIDDESCDYTSCLCPNDLNGNGMIEVGDILLLLSDFGCMTPPCIGDVNGDGVTSVADALLILAQFGEACPE